MHIQRRRHVDGTYVHTVQVMKQVGVFTDSKVLDSFHHGFHLVIGVKEEIMLNFSTYLVPV